jgi:hypothetical protein
MHYSTTRCGQGLPASTDMHAGKMIPCAISDRFVSHTGCSGNNDAVVECGSFALKGRLKPAQGALPCRCNLSAQQLRHVRFHLVPRTCAAGKPHRFNGYVLKLAQVRKEVFIII